jgi:hypothetical protein
VTGGSAGACDMGTSKCSTGRVDQFCFDDTSCGTEFHVANAMAPYPGGDNMAETKNGGDIPSAYDLSFKVYVTGATGAADAGAAGDAGAICNSVPNDAAVVAETVVAQDAPNATGGTIVDGTYFRITSTIYGGTSATPGPNGNTRKETWIVSGATTKMIRIESAKADNGGGSTHFSIIAGRSPAGESYLNALSTCGGVVGNAQFPYDASPTEIKIHDFKDGKPRISIYTKQ